MSAALDRLAYALFLDAHAEDKGSGSDRQLWRLASLAERASFRRWARDLEAAYLGKVEWKVPR